MLPAFLLSLREGLEIALIIGIVLGALKKFNRTDMNRVVWAGLASASLLSLGLALTLQRLGASLQSPFEEIFEGIMMFLAAGVLTWMIFWMNRQARFLKGKIEADVKQVSIKGGKAGLFLLAFVSVLREGIELALFFTAAAMTSGVQPAAWGAVIGLIVAAGLGWALFAATIRLDLRRFFQVTSFLLILFAAGLVAHGVHEFNEVGLIPPVIEHVWDTSGLLAEESLAGMTLKTLFGYNADPSLTEILAYFGFLAVIIIGLRRGAGVSTASREPA